MRNLDDVRKDINATDSELLKLFERRMDLTREVADYKRANNMPIYDATRENQLLAKMSELTQNKTYAPWVIKLWHDLMNYSKECQRVLLSDAPPKSEIHKGKIAFQGTNGSYGEEASAAYFGEGADICSMSSFADVFIAVTEGKCEYGVLPIENSSTGSIGDVYDLFLQYDCKIIGEYILPVHHNLMSVDGASLESIKEVYSHPQGLEQCSGFLGKYPQWIQCPYHNTAISAKYVAESGDITKAAIASERAMKIYNLKPLAKSINNNYNNYTRFVVIAKDFAKADGLKKVSVTFGLKHEEGQLCKVINVFEKYAVNLLKIESRPIAGKSWEYNFYIDFECSLPDEEIDCICEEIKSKSTAFALMGKYKPSLNN